MPRLTKIQKAFILTGCFVYIRFILIYIHISFNIFQAYTNKTLQKHELEAKESWGCEFSLCERAGSIIDNSKKIFSNTLKIKKNLKDMHTLLVDSITDLGNKSVSKEVLNKFPKLLLPGFLSSHFYLKAYLLVYLGAGFYASTDLPEFEIPTSYNELDKILKVAHVLLQVKVSNIFNHISLCEIYLNSKKNFLYRDY